MKKHLFTHSTLHFDVICVIVTSFALVRRRNGGYLAVAAAAAATTCVFMSMLFVTLQERSGNNSFTHESLSLKYKLDNEFELIFVVSLNINIYIHSN